MAIWRHFLKLLCVSAALFLAGCGTMTSSSPDASTVRPAKDFSPQQRADIAVFVNQMVEKHGFDKAALSSVFRKVNRSDRALQLVTPEPVSKPRNWEAYRTNIVDSARIKAGVKFWKKHRKTLREAEKTYGVPAEIIVGIIGVESFYGRHKGKFRVLDVLTTLSVEYPEHPKRDVRMAFFRQELEQALLFARESGADPLSLNGSYAGAIGLAQFMPGSIRRFGVDFDKDDRVDMGNSSKDAIGSVANYLKKHGWIPNADIVARADVTDVRPDGLSRLLGQGLQATFTRADLEREGVKWEEELQEDLKYGLIDLQNGDKPAEYWIVTENFFAITKYNRSYLYAMSVVTLGEAVGGARQSKRR